MKISGLVAVFNVCLYVFEDALQISLLLFLFFTFEYSVRSVYILEPAIALLLCIFVPLENPHDSLYLLEFVIIDINMMSYPNEWLVNVLDCVQFLASIF